MSDKEELKRSVCTKCGSSKVCYGYMGSGGNVFVPSGIFTVHGYRIRAFVCLRCGYIENYIPEDKLQKLRDKIADIHREE